MCSDCHGEHLILGPKEQGSLVNASRVSMATCGRCHNDERLELRYNLPADRVPSYADSYHGLALRGGSQSVANCASCHGVHNIFRSNDPRSTVNAANLSKTCGNCHAGAGDHFRIGPVHVRITTGAAHPVVKWIRWTYLLLIPMTLGFMILHNLIDFFAKLMRRQPRHESGAKVIADESQLPHRACRRDSEFPDAGFHRVRAEISRGMVGAAAVVAGRATSHFAARCIALRRLCWLLPRSTT